MNFFKSIVSDDADPPNPDKSPESKPNSPPNPPEETDDENDAIDKGLNANPSPNSSADATGSMTSVGGWSFGGLIKTFATRSESVLETYRRDLQEFGSGLKKETELFRDVASRAVKDLPASIEVGASVAHGSLESVTHAVDVVIKSTTEIISHGNGTVISSSEVELKTPDTSGAPGSGRYNRFDAQLNVIQNDINTFCEEPEDLEDYRKWRLRFALDEKDDEVENLIGGTGVLEDVYRRVVPNVVDDESFWCRYFYRVHKLKQQESVRADLVKRAISIDDEEELTWDVDDDDVQQQSVKSKGDELEKKAMGEQSSSSEPKQESTSDKPQSSISAAVNENEEDKSIVDDVVKDNVVQLSEVSVSDEKAKLEESSRVKNEETLVKDNEKVKKEEKLVKDVEKASSEGKVDHDVESGKDSDVSVVSSQKSVHEEEDLGWDEIEDLGVGDERKVNPITKGGSPNRSDLRKRLSAAEEDEDLSWDIEDDD